MKPLWNILLFLLLSLLLSRLSSRLKERRKHEINKDLLKVDLGDVLKKAVRILNDPDAPHSSHIYAMEMLKETNSAEGKRTLADYTFLGTWQLKNDYPAALKLYEELADGGDPHALYMLGLYYAEGIIYERDFPKVSLPRVLITYLCSLWPSLPTLPRRTVGTHSWLVPICTRMELG